MIEFKTIEHCMTTTLYLKENIIDYEKINELVSNETIKKSNAQLKLSYDNNSKDFKDLFDFKYKTYLWFNGRKEINLASLNHSTPYKQIISINLDGSGNISITFKRLPESKIQQYLKDLFNYLKELDCLKKDWSYDLVQYQIYSYIEFYVRVNESSYKQLLNQLENISKAIGNYSLSNDVTSCSEAYKNYDFEKNKILRPGSKVIGKFFKGLMLPPTDYIIDAKIYKPYKTELSHLSPKVEIQIDLSKIANLQKQRLTYYKKTGKLIENNFEKEYEDIIKQSILFLHTITKDDLESFCEEDESYIMKKFNFENEELVLFQEKLKSKIKDSKHIEENDRILLYSDPSSLDNDSLNRCDFNNYKKKSINCIINSLKYSIKSISKVNNLKEEEILKIIKEQI